jgi:hypothetical protein
MTILPQVKHIFSAWATVGPDGWLRLCFDEALMNYDNTYKFPFLFA